jgi:LysM repeat protein
MAAQPAPNSSARLIAPVALAVFAILFFAVILSNGSSDDKKGKQSSAATGKKSSKSTRKTKSRIPARSTYTVKIGDNLPAIARKTGVSVEKIQEVNPQLDPYGLQAGQKVKLRE